MMKLSKKHKMYGAVIVVAAGGLAVDRFVLSAGPAEAQAAPMAVVEGAVAASGTAPATTPGAMEPNAAEATNIGPVIADRLDTLAAANFLELGQSSDAFDPGSKWRVEEEGAQTQAGASSDQHPFVRDHRLDAALVSPDGGVAIISGAGVENGQKAFKVGEVIRGFTLTEVQARSVVLTRGNVRVELSLQAADRPR